MARMSKAKDVSRPYSKKADAEKAFVRKYGGGGYTRRIVKTKAGYRVYVYRT